MGSWLISSLFGFGFHFSLPWTLSARRGKGLDDLLRSPCHPLPHPFVGEGLGVSLEMAQSLVRYLDIDKCLECEIKALGDLCLFDMVKVSNFSLWFSSFPINSCPTWSLVYFIGLVRTRALQIRCIAKKASVKRLRNHLADKEVKLRT